MPMVNALLAGRKDLAVTRYSKQPRFPSLSRTASAIEAMTLSSSQVAGGAALSGSVSEALTLSSAQSYPGSAATTFDSLYAGGWTLNSATDAKTLPTQSKPAKSTNIMTGGYRDQRYDTEIRRTTAIADQVNSTAPLMRHEYSRRQPFNADSTRKLVQGSGGWWFLYDTSTNAVIPSGETSGQGQNGIQGMAGDCEPIWHPTDPTKFWHTDNNASLVWRERTLGASGTAPASVTLFNLASNLSALGSPWTTVARVWFNGEGRPSHDGRWWFMAAETSGMFSVMLRERRVARLVSRGNTWEKAGTNNTSSKVSALPRRRMSKLQMANCTCAARSQNASMRKK